MSENIEKEAKKAKNWADNNFINSQIFRNKEFKTKTIEVYNKSLEIISSLVDMKAELSDDINRKSIVLPQTMSIINKDNPVLAWLHPGFDKQFSSPIGTHLNVYKFFKSALADFSTINSSSERSVFYNTWSAVGIGYYYKIESDPENKELLKNYSEEYILPTASIVSKDMFDFVTYSVKVVQNMCPIITIIYEYMKLLKSDSFTYENVKKYLESIREYPETSLLETASEQNYNSRKISDWAVER